MMEEEKVVGIGDSVCDKYSGTCGRIVDILNDEVLIEPTIRKKADKELEVTEPPIRAKKINLEPDHIRRAKLLYSNPPQDEELRAQITRLAGEVGRLRREIQRFLPPPSREELERKRLWRGRITRGECELVHEILGKYALYKSYHHLPTSELYVETTPLAYVGQYA